MFSSRERSLDVRRLCINGQRDDNSADVRAGKECSVILAVVIISVGVNISLSNSGECSGRGEGAREDGFESEEGGGFDGRLEGS